MTDEKKLQQMIDDIDPSATILVALSEDRKVLHTYGALDPEGRKQMALALHADPITRKGFQDIIENLTNALSNSIMMEHDKMMQKHFPDKKELTDGKTN